MNFLQWFKGLLSVFDLNAIQFPGSRNTGLITQEAAYLNNNAGLWVYYSNLVGIYQYCYQNEMLSHQNHGKIRYI